MCEGAIAIIARRKLILSLAALFALNIALISLVQSARAEAYERGDSGATVREIQSRLRDWGYYDGSVDGIYGSATEKAVRRLFSAEARGEPYAGQVAVGAVVLNRVEHPSFPNTIAEVIYQPGAFSCLLDGQWDEPVADSAWSAARDALAGADPSGGAIYYFNPSTATSAWIWSRPEILTIGNHRFCA